MTPGVAYLPECVCWAKTGSVIEYLPYHLMRSWLEHEWAVQTNQLFIKIRMSTILAPKIPRRSATTQEL